MARVGVVGLGRVGLPLALTLARHGGHEVTGFDLDYHRVFTRLADPQDHGEARLGALIGGPETRRRFALASRVDALTSRADVILIAVQTPHPPGQDGGTPLPAEPTDFDYDPLSDAVRAVVATPRFTDPTRPPPVLGVVSTVLPGTLRRVVRPLLGRAGVTLVYCPVLVSLGSVVSDLLNPPLTLVGTDDQVAATPLVDALHQLNGVTASVMSVESAELLKLTWNAFISTKIVLANTVAELCQTLPRADVGDVTAGLVALDRHDWGGHLRAGLGDGGPCRPRDAAALAHLAREVDTSYDPFTALTRAREAQADRLARTVVRLATGTGLPVRVLGLAYRAGGQLTDGSPAWLLTHYLQARGVASEAYDPRVVPPRWPPPGDPAVYVVATPHPEVLALKYPRGSLIIDPWGLVPNQGGVEVRRLWEATG